MRTHSSRKSPSGKGIKTRSDAYLIRLMKAIRIRRMANTTQDCRRHQFNLAACRWLVFLLCFRIFFFGQQVSISAKKKEKKVASSPSMSRRQRCRRRRRSRASRASWSLMTKFRSGGYLVGLFLISYFPAGHQVWPIFKAPDADATTSAS